MPSKLKVSYPNWEEITSDEKNGGGANPLQALLIQAIAILSTQTRFERMTPSEVYEYLVKHTQEVEEL